MLFKFASYLLGTNTEQSDPPQETADQVAEVNQTAAAALNLESSTSITNTNHPSTDQSIKTNVESDEEIRQKSNLSGSPAHQTEQQLENHNELIYDEQLVQSEDRPERLEDSLLEDDDDQWIYITPVVKKLQTESNIENSLKCNSNSENTAATVAAVADETDDKAADEQTDQPSELTGRFNFYDYFNNQHANANGRPAQVNNGGQRNKLEESWVIHPPACFQVDNTFAIEQHPLENLYIEQPAMSVIRARCNTNENKENSSPKKKQDKNGNKSSGKRQKTSNNKRQVNTRKTKNSKRSEKNTTQTTTSAAASETVQSLAVLLSGANQRQQITFNPPTLPVPAMMQPVETPAANTATAAPAAHGSPKPGSSGKVACSKSICDSKRAFHRKSFSTRPFTIHRKLC